MIGHRHRNFWLAGVLLASACGLSRAAEPAPAAEPKSAPAPAVHATAARPGSTNATASPMDDKVMKTDKEWRQLLTPEQYRILRGKGTERAFTGAYWNHHAKGIYACAGCGQVLFSSTNKFDSGCGWPSYDRPIRSDRVTTAEDHSLGMHRIEVMCSRCGGHLGHVFEDGPRETTGLRYCINSGSIKFEKEPRGTPPATPQP